jgi:DNA-binding NarL/FixJ family response regulator
VVDRQTLFRVGLARLLAEDARISVAGVADGGREIPDLCASMSVDVLLSDVEVRDWDVIELCREIPVVSPATRVIVLASAADWRVVPAMTSGAAGFLLKDAKPESIRSAVVAAHHGERVLCSEATSWLLQDGPDFSLTRRERDVLRMVASGATNKEIADELHLGDKTIRNYVSRLYRKLAMDSRDEFLSAGLYALPALEEGP